MAKAAAPEPATTALAKTGSNSLATKPEYVTTPELGPRGFQEMETRDMTLPRLALCQAMSKQRQRGQANYIPGLEEGKFFNTLTSEIYGDVVHVIPLFFYKSRIWFKDLDQGGGILCQAPDGKHCQLNHGGACLHQAWGPNGEPPDCTEFFNYPSLLVRDDGTARELIVLSLKSTGMRAAKPWNAKMRLRGSDMFSGVYKVTSKLVPNKAQQMYYEYVIDNAELQNGWATQGQYSNAEREYTAVYTGIKEGTIIVDESNLTDDMRAQRDAEM